MVVDNTLHMQLEEEHLDGQVRQQHHGYSGSCGAEVVVLMSLGGRNTQSVSQGRIGQDKFTCCLTEKEVEGKTCCPVTLLSRTF